MDTSYTQQDYQNALMESSEPAVSANSGGGRKVRELTREELAMQKAAEERVMALVSGAVMTPKNGSPAAPSAASTTAGSPVAATDKLRAASVLAKIKLSTTEDELISQVQSLLFLFFYNEWVFLLHF